MAQAVVQGVAQGVAQVVAQANALNAVARVRIAGAVGSNAEKINGEYAMAGEHVMALQRNLRLIPPQIKNLFIGPMAPHGLGGHPQKVSRGSARYVSFYSPLRAHIGHTWY